MERVEYDQFEACLRVSRRAFHLELRDTYNVEVEEEHFARFLRGEPDTYEWLSDWFGLIREVTDAGTEVQRVRVVTEPHCDYTRWGLVVAPHAARAGEDIRYLPRQQSTGIKFPPEDFWLFDEDTLVLSVFSEDGRVGGFAREYDLSLVAQCRSVRDQVWSRAIPFAEYIS